MRNEKKEKRDLPDTVKISRKKEFRVASRCGNESENWY